MTLADWFFCENRPSCEDCWDLATENGETPACSTCDKPKFLARKNAQAWEAWCELDQYARQLDTMGGYPLPIDIAKIEQICMRYDDPEGIRWRVLLLENKALAYRRGIYQRKSKRKYAV